MKYDGSLFSSLSLKQKGRKLDEDGKRAFEVLGGGAVFTARSASVLLRSCAARARRLGSSRLCCRGRGWLDG